MNVERIESAPARQTTSGTRGGSPAPSMLHRATTALGPVAGSSTVT
ncbi:hypothetical protein QMA10_17585 [Arthrobacter sp. APC 3897]|nr:hypothetical protein [Arthrobacter sp. APC 3897]MDN3483720.1 hypothetical protein [Arthrobacter sp. APC 3897]